MLYKLVAISQSSIHILPGGGGGRAVENDRWDALAHLPGAVLSRDSGPRDLLG